MNAIYYIDIITGKLIVLKVEVTDEINKITIPKSKITKKGIFDISKEELMYYKSISYLSTNHTDKRVVDIINNIDKSDIVYIVSIQAKTIISKMIDSGIFEKNRFTKFTGIDTTFITSLILEIGNIVSDDYKVLDYDRYFKSKITLHPLMDTKQLFFYKDMPDGVYYSYSNKENIAKKKKVVGEEEPIDISKTKIVLGKKSSTNIYNVYRLKKQPIIDSIYAKFRSYLKGVNYYTIMLLNRVTSSQNIYHMDNQDLLFLETPKRLESPTGEVIISEVMPAGISYYAFQTFYELTEMLDSFINNTNSIARQSAVNITDLIFDNNHEIKHLTDFTLEYEYVIGDKKFIIPVVSSLDLPTRNMLKRLTKLKPEIHLVIINTNNVYSRYYTIVKLGDEYMITGNYPANLVLLNDK